MLLIILRKSGNEHKSKFVQPVEEMKDAGNFVKNNPEIVFTKADKVNTTVALARTDYSVKVKNLLQDENTYQARPKDTTTIIQNNVNCLVKTWEKKNLINNMLANDLKSSNAIPSRFYGLLKIHKEGNPVRPIVSCVGSPTYNLAPFLSTIISKNIIPPKIDGTTYFQKRGLPMGSLFSPVLANIVMEDLENARLSNLDFEVPVYFRYVDDILIVIPNTHVDHILQIFNTNPLNIEFTFENEFEGAINFLDVTITRKQNQKLSSNWYRKQTWSCRYLNFNSHHPPRY